MRFSNSGDFVRRTNLRINVRLAREDLINALAAAHLDDDPQDLPDALGREAALEDIREYLRLHGEDGVAYWADDVDEDDTEALREWATSVFDAAFPEALH